MTIGQVSDVVFLLLLPVLLPVFRSKGILLVGMAAWALRFGLFAWFDTARDAHWMMYLGIAVHGMCYDFIFVMGRMYVDKRASADIRGAAQGLHAFVTLGIGMFVGTWLSGVVGEHYASQGADGAVTHNWQMIWAIPAVLSVVLTMMFVASFKDREPSVKELATEE
jgi:MFS family permease